MKSLKVENEKLLTEKEKKEIQRNFITKMKDVEKQIQ